MADKDLKALFLHQLKDTYFAENAILKALPQMAEAAQAEAGTVSRAERNVLEVLIWKQVLTLSASGELKVTGRSTQASFLVAN
jgi:ferritin-like metal-binding protein YciE